MGANYSSNFIPDGDEPRTEDELKTYFSEEQRISREEDGNMYSGEIGMAEGLKIIRDKKFGSVSEADEWVDENAEKWGPALAVRVEGPNDQGWFYGAICAS